jgi:putative ABC transport system substrate-binding protein
MIPSMDRRAFLGTLTGSLLAAPLAAEAQQAGKPPRLTPFFQRLRELGYVDGQTITIDSLSADGQGQRFPGLAAECIRRKADIIVWLVASLARPGGNVTGLTFMASGLAAKRRSATLGSAEASGRARGPAPAAGAVPVPGDGQLRRPDGL